MRSPTSSRAAGGARRDAAAERRPPNGRRSPRPHGSARGDRASTGVLDTLSTTSTDCPRASPSTRSWPSSSRPRASGHEQGRRRLGHAEALAFGTLVLEGTPSASPARTPAAARSASATPCSSTTRPAASLDAAHDLPARSGQVRGLRHAAVRVRRDRLRVRLLGRRPRTRSCCGRRSSATSSTARRSSSTSSSSPPRTSGARRRARPAAAARLRGPGPRALQRPHRALPHAVRRGQHPGRATPRPRRSTSTCCAARCAGTSAKPLIVFTPKRPLRMKESRSPIDGPDPGLVPGGARRPGGEPTLRGGCFSGGWIKAFDAMAERDQRQARRPSCGSSSCSRSPWTRSSPSSSATPGPRTWSGSRKSPGLWVPGPTSGSRCFRIKNWGRVRNVTQGGVGSPATGSATIHEQELADLLEGVVPRPLGGDLF